MVNQRIESPEMGGCADASTCVKALLRTVRGKKKLLWPQAVAGEAKGAPISGLTL